MCATMGTLAQVDSAGADRPPSYPGGDNVLNSFIERCRHYPDSAYNYGIEGCVILNMVIDTNGAVTDVRLIKGVSGDIDAEALRIARMLPVFAPAIHQGRKVKFIYSLSIDFQLKDNPRRY